MTNIQANLLSFAYIALVIEIATIISKKSSKEVSRKFIHILLGNWVLFYPFYTNLFSLIFVPFVFIIINLLSTKYTLISAMEHEEDVGYGTVYYALSLLLLSSFSFILRNPIPFYVGTLSMAYGDGFAALIGKRFGKKHPISTSDKSYPGTITVFSVTVGVTLICLMSFGPSNLNLLAMILISIINGCLGSLVEFIGTDGTDNLFLPISTGVFAYLSTMQFDIYYSIAILVMIIILYYAYRKNSITLGGSATAFLTGICLYQLGDAYLFANLLVFFVGGSIVSKISNSIKQQGEALQSESGARTWIQVLANSLPATLIVWAIHLDPQFSSLKLLPFVVLSVPFADTFASELGMLSKGTVRSIVTWKRLPVGLSGGITVFGTFAGLIGAGLSALFVIPTYGIQAFLNVLTLGFIGMLIDSILGATIQRKYTDETYGLRDAALSSDQKSTKGFEWVSNSTINILTILIVTSFGFALLY